MTDLNEAPPANKASCHDGVASLKEAVSLKELPHTKRLPKQNGCLVNVAEHKTMPYMMELLKTMRLSQKIRKTKKIWQDETS